MSVPRILPSAIAVAILALSLGLQGCGGSGSSTASSATNGSKPAPIKLGGRTPTIDLSSPGVNQAGLFASSYTCDGKNTWPTLSWNSVPSGTTELALFVLQLGAGETGKTTVQWALAGLSPSLHSITTGKLPPRAIVGRDSDGRSRYFLCPPRGAPSNYAVILLALPKRLGLKPGFKAESVLNNLVATEPPFGGIYTHYQRS